MHIANCNARIGHSSTFSYWTYCTLCISKKYMLLYELDRPLKASETDLNLLKYPEILIYCVETVKD